MSEEDDETLLEPTTTAKKRAPRRKNGTPHSPPVVALGVSPEVAQMTARMQRHAERLEANDYYPPGETVRGLDGYQQEIEVLSHFGKLTNAGMTLKRVVPPGPNGRPVDLRPLARVPMSAAEFYDYCVDNLSGDTDVTIEWRIMRGMTAETTGGRHTCVGYFDIPPRPKAAPEPSPQQTRGDAGISNHQPPPWQQTPASPSFSGQPQGYPPGYPPQGYPQQYPPQQGAYPGYPYPPPYGYPQQPSAPSAPAPQTPAPALAPAPAPNGPDLHSRLETRLDGLAAHIDRLAGEKSDGELRGLREALQALRDQMAATPTQQAAPAAPALAPAPAAPTRDEDILDRVVGLVERVETAKTRLGYRPAQEAAPAPAPIVEHITEDDSPVGVLSGGEGTLAIPYDRKTGNTKMGTLFLQNIPMFARQAEGLFDKILRGQAEADERQARLAKERDDARKRDAAEVENLRHQNRMAELAAERRGAPAPHVDAPAPPPGPRPWGKK